MNAKLDANAPGPQLGHDIAQRANLNIQVLIIPFLVSMDNHRPRVSHSLRAVMHSSVPFLRCTAAADRVLSTVPAVIDFG
jgi:hypothetical protein